MAKTSHGLVRGPSRFPIAAVIDASCAGQDAGVVLDGQHRGIPILADVSTALAELTPRPEAAIVGVATPGGVLPSPLRRSLLAAAAAGLTLYNGLHRGLAEDETIAAAASAGSARIVDFRRGLPGADLRHWHGKILELTTPRVAVLGTDCCIGKRTTCTLLLQALRSRGVRAEMIYTGQTGWLQGHDHGFFFDATPNDFVSGELERVILECAGDKRPQVMLLEGQSAFFNPSGPCGAEFVLSGGAKHVVIQHAPGREYFDDLEHTAMRIDGVGRDVAMARLLGAEVLAITLHGEKRSIEALRGEAAQLEAELQLPVVLPLHDGVDAIATRIAAIADSPV